MDDEWSIGNSGFGYADGDDNTYIAAGTLAVYLRKSFTIEDISEINSLVLDVDYDDGFVAYINGVEVARANINGTPPIYNSTTQIDHEAQMYTGGIPDRFLIDNYEDLLVDGNNVFSIQVHNISNTSSDMTIIPFLGFQGQSFMHTDFKLSSSGESVYLNDALGNLVDSITFGALPSNISYGVSFENDVYVAYEDPTPGEENDTFEYAGVLGVPLTFSHDGGSIDSTINLEITGDGTEDEIRYTTDFTEPNQNSNLYTGPLTIDETSIIRAKAFKEGYISLHSNTRNYFLNIQSHDPCFTKFICKS